MSTKLEMDLNLTAGQQLKIRGFVLSDAKRFHVDLGSNADNLALHFNPRYEDKIDGVVIVCNSKTDGHWAIEQRQKPNPIQRGTDVTIVVKLYGDMFRVELPNGQEVQFPKRVKMDVIRYIHISGDFKLTSLEIEMEIKKRREAVTVQTHGCCAWLKMKLENCFL